MFIKKLSAKIHSALINSILLVGSLALALLAAEFLFRVCCVDKLHLESAPPRILLHEFTPHNPNLLYRPAANTESQAHGVVNRINALGFRGREARLEKDPDSERIVFLGDSVVYGYRVGEAGTIPRALEAALQKRGKKAEVLNLGVSGYDTIQTVEFFKQTGRRLKPDTVILGYTLNDSIYGSMELRSFQDDAGSTLKEPGGKWNKIFLRTLFEKSTLLRFLDQRFRLQMRFKFLRPYEEKSLFRFIEERNRVHKDSPESPYQKLRGTVEQDAKDLGTHAESLKQHLSFIGMDNPDFWSSHWNLSKKAAQELALTAEQDGIRLIAVIFPYMLDMPHYPLASVHRFLESEFREMGYEVIDLMPLGEKMDKIYGKAVLKDPIHFNSVGARLIGEEIAANWPSPPGTAPE